MISDRSYIFVLSVLIGIFSALSAILLKRGVAFLHETLQHRNRFDYTDYIALIFPIIGIGLTVVLKKWVLRDTIKHNITSILHAISRRNSLMRTHKVLSSLTGGVLTAGFGGSVGLEAPIISSGSAIGSNLGRVLRLDYKTITLMLACGATGAMSAIFHTPITAVVFALEVLLIDLSQFTLIPLLLSSISGSLVSKILQDPELIFNSKSVDNYLSVNIPYFIVFGIVAGLLAVYFTRLYLYVEARFEKIGTSRKKLLIGSGAIGLLIILFPPLYGEGFRTIRLLLMGQPEMILQDSLLAAWSANIWAVLLFFSALALLKVIATAITIGAGGIGGIFAPSLFTGALGGYLFAFVLNQTQWFHTLSTRNFTLIGMAAVLGGVLQAPLTGVFLIAEITGGYMLMVPLMLTTTIAYITTKYLQPNSIITTQLATKGELITHHKDKAVLSLMEVSSVIETDLLPVDIDERLGHLVEVISKSKRNVFPVVNKQNELRGIIYLDDVREVMFQNELYNKLAVQELMKPILHAVETKDTMNQVMQKFKATKAWNLPVTQQGKYIGFVSKSKIFNVYRQLLVDLSSD